MEETAASSSRSWWACAAIHAATAAVAALPLCPRFGIPVVPFTLAYLAGLLALCSVLRSRVAAVLARHRVALAVAVLGVAAVAALDLGLYPGSRTGPSPSTAPDALIAPARNLIRGDFPYAVDLRDRAPASPGIGWVVLNAPLTLTGLVPLLSAVWLGVAAASLARRSAPAAAVFVILNLANLHFLRLGIVGHDLFPATCGLVAVLAALVGNDRRPSPRLSWIAVAAGVVSTARVPFVLFPAVAAFLLLRRDRSAGIRFGALSLGTAGVLHGVMMAWAAASGSWYQPLHVFGRAGRDGSGFLVLGAVAWFIAAAIVLKRGRDEASAWFAQAWLLFATPFALVGLGELSAASWAIAGWEGVNYVAFGLPLLAASVALAWEPAAARRW